MTIMEVLHVERVTERGKRDSSYKSRGEEINMTYYWKDHVNHPKQLPTPEEREELLKRTLEQLEKEGLNSNRGTGAWRAGLRAEKALDQAYGKDRGV